MKPVAVFDVDGTIFRSSLTVELVEGLIHNSIFSEDVRSEYTNEKESWLNRQEDYQTYINAVERTFVTHIKGVHYSDFLNVAKDVARLYQGRVYRFTRDLLADLKADGYFLLAVSQSPKGILDLFCESMGFDKTYGRFYELGPSDRFTGSILDEHIIANKAHIVKRALEKEPITIHGSYGVGDTEDDISFLEHVTYPICFNPNKSLYQHAKLNGWRVVVERKDVMYEIQG